jgi:hypothetical protein
MALDPHSQDKLDQLIDEVSSSIKNKGRYIVHVNGTDTTPRFSYTIGLHELHNHPEVVITGLPPAVAEPVLHNLAYRVREGRRFVDGSISKDDGLLHDYALIFKSVPFDKHEKLFGLAFWYYKTNDFPSVQCVWPDRNHQYPWSDKVDAAAKRDQVLFVKND